MVTVDCFAVGTGVGDMVESVCVSWLVMVVLVINWICVYHYNREKIL